MEQLFCPIDPSFYTRDFVYQTFLIWNSELRIRELEILIGIVEFWKYWYLMYLMEWKSCPIVGRWIKSVSILGVFDEVEVSINAAVPLFRKYRLHVEIWIY